MHRFNQPIWSLISSSFDGLGKAYIYLWISKKWRVIYVGQTNEKQGSFGRAYSHIQAQGTFRKRFEEELGIRIEEADDLILVSYPLPQQPEYIGVESSYREAVEYLVQIKLRDIRGSVEPKFKLISKVRYTDRASNLMTEELANEIVKDFKENYSSICF
jgi:hypothetical protein